MKFLDLIEQIEDPRASWGVKHNLSTIIFCTLSAILCGAESWSDIEDFCESKIDWLSEHVNFNNGIPSEFTIRRIFTLIDPAQLEWLLRVHAANILGSNNIDHIAIDGKALCGSKRHNLRCINSISAMCHEHGLILAEMAVDKKSNEITAIPTLLDVLQIKGSTITIDAAGCQENIAKIIIEKQGDYVLALKKNHPKFYETVENHCQQNIINQEHRLKDYFDNSHGRLTRRRYFSCNIKEIEGGVNNWSGLKSVIALETISSKNIEKKVSSEWRYYISSHNHKNLNLPEYIRNNWSIENKTHWVLDVNLGEDADQKSERRSAKAFSVLRRIALNIARSKDTNSKRSLRRKFKCAGWDNDYLLNLLI